MMFSTQQSSLLVSALLVVSLLHLLPATRATFNLTYFVPDVERRSLATTNIDDMDRRRSLVTMAASNIQWNVVVPCALSWDEVTQISSSLNTAADLFAAIAPDDDDRTTFAVPCSLTLSAQTTNATFMVVRCDDTSHVFGLRLRRLLRDAEVGVVRAECQTAALTVTRDALVHSSLSSSSSSSDVQPAPSVDESPAAPSEPSEYVQLTPATHWHLDRLDQRESTLDGYYKYVRTGQGVTVYVVDTGVRASHIDFDGPDGGESRAENVMDFVGDGEATTGGGDCNGHGTHVSSLCCGRAYGVAKNAQVKHLRVLNCDGDGAFSSVILALLYVKEQVQETPHSAVVSMSITGAVYAPINQLVNELVNMNRIAVIVAAGNQGSDACLYSPASAAAALTVSASTRKDGLADFSNAGSCANLAAPGVTITAACVTSDVAVCAKSGTSMSTPIVAGLVALHMEQQLIDNNGGGGGGGQHNLTRADGPLAMASLMADTTEDRVDTLYDSFYPLPLAFSNVGRPPIPQAPPPPPPQKPPVPKNTNPFRVLGRTSEASVLAADSSAILYFAVVLLFTAIIM